MSALVSKLEAPQPKRRVASVVTTLGGSFFGADGASRFGLDAAQTPTGLRQPADHRTSPTRC